MNGSRRALGILATTSASALLALAATATDLHGRVIARDGQRVQVEVLGDGLGWPAVGDAVEFSALLAGLEARAGRGTVVELEAGLAWVEVSAGHPPLEASAKIEASGRAGLKTYQLETICAIDLVPSEQSPDFPVPEQKPCQVRLELPEGLAQSNSVGRTSWRAASLDGKRTGFALHLESVSRSAEYGSLDSLRKIYDDVLEYSLEPGQTPSFDAREMAGASRCLIRKSAGGSTLRYDAICTDSADPIRQPSARGTTIAPLIWITAEVPRSSLTEESHEAWVLGAVASLDIGGKATSAMVLSALGRRTESGLELKSLRLKGGWCCIGQGFGRHGEASLELALPADVENSLAQQRISEGLPARVSLTGKDQSPRIVIASEVGEFRESLQTLLEFHREHTDPAQAKADPSFAETRWRDRSIVGGSHCLADLQIFSFGKELIATCSDRADPLQTRDSTGAKGLAPVYSLRFVVEGDFDEARLLESLQSLTIHSRGPGR